MDHDFYFSKALEIFSKSKKINPSIIVKESNPHMLYQPLTPYPVDHETDRANAAQIKNQIIQLTKHDILYNIYSYKFPGILLNTLLQGI